MQAKENSTKEFFPRKKKERENEKQENKKTSC